MTVEIDIDLAELISCYLGPPVPRRGASSRRPWWCCPFYDDKNPSLSITPNGKGWYCFGCWESGDAITWVRKFDPSLGFREAVKELNGDFSSVDAKSKMAKMAKMAKVAKKSSRSPLAILKPAPPTDWQR